MSKASAPFHSFWVKTSHWIITIAFLLLTFSGIEILMVHPRLYWGETGNDLTPALLELPISRNYKHGGFEKRVPFFDSKESPVSAARTYDIFNENGWGRSLHFLAAWVLVLAGTCYLAFGFFTRHFNRNIFPRRSEFSIQHFLRDLKDHARMSIPTATGGPAYGFLQKFTYAAVIFVALPVMVVTGFTMAPAITAAFPFLLKMFGGFQSARTIHFFASFALELFLVVHIAMVIRSGFKKQIRAMTIGIQYEKKEDLHAS